MGSSKVPEFIDPVFANTSPKRSFSLTENKHFGLVFVKTGSIIQARSDLAFNPIPGGPIGTIGPSFFKGHSPKKFLNVIWPTLLLPLS